MIRKWVWRRLWKEIPWEEMVERERERKGWREEESRNIRGRWEYIYFCTYTGNMYIHI